MTYNQSNHTLIGDRRVYVLALIVYLALGFMAGETSFGVPLLEMYYITVAIGIFILIWLDTVFRMS